MNTQKLRNIISLYKENFDRINREEIYKWEAVKHFQDNFRIEAFDFPGMLKQALSKTKNLMSSQGYYPRRMINFFAAHAPEKVREAFRKLYNEDADLLERIKTFQTEMKYINLEYQIKDNVYQDLRAVAVYLSLKYPERYYFFKYKMVRAFVPLIDYPVQPISGRNENILEFQSLCDIIKAELIKDPDLLQLHKKRITKKEYHDTSLNILTQDVIYAAVRHINTFHQTTTQPSAKSRLIELEFFGEPTSHEPVLKGRFKNYIENERERKRIGDLGELLVLQYEEEKLRDWKITKQPEHISKTEGDGLGYDILSYDRQENPIYIEVKTTRGPIDTPFYITAHERAQSIAESNRFYLYRLYEYNEDLNTARFYRRGGDLTELCNNPVLYFAKFSKSTLNG